MCMCTGVASKGEVLYSYILKQLYHHVYTKDYYAVAMHCFYSMEDQCRNGR